jgi:predicted RNase H-like HicB family nuclease
MKNQYFNAVITEEDGEYVALNPDTGIASQGKDVNESLANLREALLLYFEEVGSTENLSHQSFLTTSTL